MLRKSKAQLGFKPARDIKGNKLASTLNKNKKSLDKENISALLNIADVAHPGYEEGLQYLGLL